MTRKNPVYFDVKKNIKAKRFSAAVKEEMGMEGM